MPLGLSLPCYNQVEEAGGAIDGVDFQDPVRPKTSVEVIEDINSTTA
jgi:hypothetical protein